MKVVPFLLLVVALIFCSVSAWAYGWWSGLLAGIISLAALHWYDYRIGPGWGERRLFEIYSFAIVFAGWALGLTVRAILASIGADDANVY